MPLRQADISATRRFEDGDAWLVLRVNLTKGESDAIRDAAMGYSLRPGDLAGKTPEEAAAVEITNRTAAANRKLFEILCDSWSLGEVSGDAYSRLDDESGEWVDECIQEVLAERRKRAEKNGRSSAKPRRRASSSARAAA